MPSTFLCDHKDLAFLTHWYCLHKWCVIFFLAYLNALHKKNKTCCKLALELFIPIFFAFVYCCASLLFKSSKGWTYNNEHLEVHQTGWNGDGAQNKRKPSEKSHLFVTAFDERPTITKFPTHQCNARFCSSCLQQSMCRPLCSQTIVHRGRHRSMTSPVPLPFPLHTPCQHNCCRTRKYALD